MKHTCIKPSCGKQYEDTDIDAYYCPPCNEQRLIIAKEIEAKYPTTLQARPMSNLQIFEAQAKTIQAPNGRSISFAPTKL